MSVISLSSFLLVSSFPISFLSLLWQFRYSSLALVLLLLFPCLHISLKLLRNCFLSFLSVFIVSFEVFIFLLVSKDIFPICLFNADIIALWSVSYPWYSEDFQILHISSLYPFHFSMSPFFQMWMISGLWVFFSWIVKVMALWSVTCFPLMLRVLFVSVSDSQILSLRPFGDHCCVL